MNAPRSTGVIVGRFQIDDLHEGHYDLLKTVSDSHDRMLVIIGLSPCRCTVNNPLDFDTRRRMLMEAFPDAKVGYVEDMYSDTLWSEALDTVISQKARTEDVMLYGSRDSFIKHYKGVYKTKVLEQRAYISASKIREGLSLRSRATADFRAGAIWALMNQWPAAIPTIDVAVVSEDKKRILLAKRDVEDKYRFVGGFVGPGEAYSETAVRELQEEASIKATRIRPIESFFIDDHRYKSEQNKITTMLYLVESYEGKPSPADDVDELKWFDINGDVDLHDIVVPNHKQMMLYLLTNVL